MKSDPVTLPSPSQQDGSPDAKPEFKDVFESEETPLLHFAFGFVGRRAVAEEIVQDAFLQLHRHWDTVDNPRPWLYRCVRNRSLNHIRDHKRETLSDPLDTESRTEDPREAPDAVLGCLEATGQVRALVSELPERDRRLIELKYYDGLKYKEISTRTGLTVGNVGYRLHHLLKHLADGLRRLGVEHA